MARLKLAQISEHQEQASLFQWRDAMLRSMPELRLLFAIPGQGVARLKNLQIEGYQKGIPDMMLAVARGEYHGLFVELKRRKGGKVSPEQYTWIAALASEGYAATVCYGWDEARETIQRYLNGDEI